MAASDCFVSVVAPLQNDGAIVGVFLDELCDVLKRHYTHYEIVLVDDGSTDSTVEAVGELLSKHEYCRLLRLSRPFGVEMAILAGLESVIGDFVVVMIPDTDPPRLVPEMVELARRGAGMVTGVRRARVDEPGLMRLGVRLFYWYCNRVLKMSIPVNSTHFRVVSRQVVNAIIRIKDRTRHLRMYGAYIGFPHTEFEYEPVSRSGRPTRRSMGEAVGLAVAVVVANSTHPLRVVSILGIAISGLNALYACWVLLTRLFAAEVAPGWAGLSLQSAVMFFFLFLSLAVLAEYVGRILGETRDRPLYYVAEERKSSVLLDEDARRNVVSTSVAHGPGADQAGNGASGGAS